MDRLAISKLALLTLAMFGVWSAAEISYAHFFQQEECPAIGPIPACYIVLAGYLAMLGGGWRSSRAVFVIGWVPVFLLAAAGVFAEVVSESAICPRTASGLPKCFVSLGVAMLLGLLGWITLFPASSRATA